MDFIDVVKTPCGVAMQTEDRYITMYQDTKGKYVFQDVCVEKRSQDGKGMVYITAQTTRIKRIRLEWTLEIKDEVRVLGDAWERGYGDLEWRGIVPERIFPWYVIVHDVAVKTTHSYGVETGSNALCFWMLDGHKLQLILDVRNGSTGVDLDGRSLHAASIVCREGKKNETAFKAVKDFCRIMCPSPRLPKGIVYGSNNWYYAYGKSSEEEILMDADLMCELASGLEERPFMVIDDGWQFTHGCSCSGGPWDSGNYKFPDMKKLADDLKIKRLRPGLWIRPLKTYECFPEECILHKWTMEGCGLDPSHPNVLKYVEKMFADIRAWGYELIKHDFTTFDIFGKWGNDMGKELTDPEWHFYDTKKTTAEIILQFYRAIRKGAGDETLIMGCNTISHLSAGIFEIQRTGDDTSGREWERTRKMGINTLAFRMPQNGTFYTADADCAGITEFINWELNQQWISLLAESGTAMFVSADPKALTEQKRNILKEAFRVFTETKREAVPLNWMNTTCPDVWETQYGIRKYYFCE